MDRFTDRQIELVRASFARLAADPVAATDAFYERLFELDPRLRFMFPPDLGGHRRELLAMMTFLIRRLDAWDETEHRVENLGVRHAAYGVRESDYRTFEQAVLDTLSRRLGLAEDPETLEAWRAVFDDVSDRMIRAGFEEQAEA